MLVVIWIKCFNITASSICQSNQSNCHLLRIADYLKTCIVIYNNWRLYSFSLFAILSAIKIDVIFIKTNILNLNERPNKQYLLQDSIEHKQSGNKLPIGTWTSLQNNQTRKEILVSTNYVKKLCKITKKINKIRE